MANTTIPTDTGQEVSAQIAENYAAAKARNQMTERNINKAIGDVERATRMLNRNAKRVSELPALNAITNMLIQSGNAYAIAIGATVKLASGIADILLSIQDQLIKLREETVKTGAEAGLTMNEISSWVKINIDAYSNLRSSLHVTLDSWNGYLKTYRSFAMSAFDMNTQIHMQGQEAAKTITQSLFELSSRFQMDVNDTSRAVLSSITKGGLVGADVGERAGKALDVWYDVAKSARVAGSSVPLAIKIISEITTGTEAEVTSGSTRILNMSEMYGKLFKLLADNHQQGLIEDYFKAMESGIRNMTLQSAAIFSGAPLGHPALGGASDMLTAGLDFEAGIRAARDMQHGNVVSSMDIIKVIMKNIAEYSGNKRIIAYEEAGKAVGLYQKNEFTKRYLLQDYMIQQAFPSLKDALERAKFVKILKQLDENKEMDSAERADLMKQLEESLSGEAENIEDQKLTFLTQISDSVGAMFAKMMFGESAFEKESRLQLAQGIDLIQSNSRLTKALEDRAKELNVKELSQAEVRKVTERHNKDEAEKRKKLLWTPAGGTHADKMRFVNLSGYGDRITPNVWTQQSVDDARAIGDAIYADLVKSIARGEPEWQALNDPKVSLAEKARLFDRALEMHKQKMLKGRPIAEKESIIKVFNNPNLRVAMNKFLDSKPTKDSMLNVGTQDAPGSGVVGNWAKWTVRATGLGIGSIALPFDFMYRPEVSEEAVNIYADVKRERERIKKDQAVDKTGRGPGRFSGAQFMGGGYASRIGDLTHIFEDGLIDIPQGGMVIPANQVRILSAAGGPLALIAMAAMKSPSLQRLMPSGALFSLSGAVSGVGDMLSSDSVRSGLSGLSEDMLNKFYDSLQLFTDNMNRATIGFSSIRKYQNAPPTTNTGTLSAVGRGEAIIEDPFVRQLLNASGGPGGITATPGVMPGILSVPDYVQRLIGTDPEAIKNYQSILFGIAGAESANDWFRPNDQWRSGATASGKYQFTMTTARTIWNKYKDRFEGLGIKGSDFSSLQNFHKMMFDSTLGPARQQVLMHSLTAESIETLKKNNIPVNLGTVYALHYLGTSALEYLRSDWSKFVHSMFTPSTTYANAAIGSATARGEAYQREFDKALASGTILGRTEITKEMRAHMNDPRNYNRETFGSMSLADRTRSMTQWSIERLMDVFVPPPPVVSLGTDKNDTVISGQASAVANIMDATGRTISNAVITVGYNVANKAFILGRQ